MIAPQFPPLLSGMELTDARDPMAVAITEAKRGCDAGLVVYNLGPDTVRAAIVFAPEVPLSAAIAMLPVCGVGFQNALGALAPPEVAVHLQWDGGILLNGARCGALRVAASTTEQNREPDWLVISLSLSLIPAQSDTGLTPEETSLYAEGCGDIAASTLLESWTKHTLVWINRWSEEGAAPLHRNWEPLLHGIGEMYSTQSHSGTFIGVDEDFGMLLKSNDETLLIPLTTLLESTT
ncbi:DUF4444 domain-containing protein [Falsihalocynthiibacter sp. SS001]|uniref:biotin/lipoate--protein ligase family protein n=1 Tax=Falsihalocynthiibacter sp. SS001 TaxID=3349698 RepID=UPI0036D38306